ncbi:hypothetical protein [Methylorubrum sp. SB2]|uniref:hypothetical protein n=1 Tax=Methylorubrum subtropicum TaxID=3138812 RepID=UPI00313EE5F9
MTLLILPNSTTVQNPCRIAYDNLLERGAVAASSEDPSYPVANAYDGLTCDFFRPTATGTVTITLTLPMGGTANYFAFYNQDLFKSGGSIGLQYYDGTAWQNATPGVTPSNNAPRIVFFNPVTATQWRVLITCSQQFNLGVVSFGQYLALPYGMYLGWTPPRLGRATKLTTSMSDAGAFLGRRIIGNGIRTALQLQYASDAWMDANWLGFVRHAEQKPWFFAPQVVKRPNDVAFCWTEDEIPPPTHTHYGFMGTTINLRVVVE